jgi:hypothetical protein
VREREGKKRYMLLCCPSTTTYTGTINDPSIGRDSHSRSVCGLASVHSICSSLKYTYIFASLAPKKSPIILKGVSPSSGPVPGSKEEMEGAVTQNKMSYKKSFKEHSYHCRSVCTHQNSAHQLSPHPPFLFPFLQPFCILLSCHFAT